MPTYEDKLLNLDEAKEVISEVVPMIEGHKEIDFGVFLGVAWDSHHPEHDRRRLYTAVSHFFIGRAERPVFLLCIDPNFTKENLEVLRHILTNWYHPKDEKRKLQANGHGHGHEYEYESNLLAGSKITLLSGDKFIKLEKHYPYSSPPYTQTAYILFLRYMLPSAYSNHIGSRDYNQLNIQNGTITRETYIDRCIYQDTSMYKTIERIAMIPNIQNVYFASAASSHTPGAVLKNQNISRPYFAPKSKEFGTMGHYRIDNRFLEGFCELHRLMKNIYDNGKAVYFLTLDYKFPTFTHSSLKNEDISFRYSILAPYAVPINNTTTFNTDKLLTPPPGRASVSTQRRIGGKHKTRKYSSQKQKKSRKQRK